MISPDQSCFGYNIRQTASGWSWVTYDLDGGVQAQGSAPDKALAAACVIRALARAATEQPSRKAA